MDPQRRAADIRGRFELADRVVEASIGIRGPRSVGGLLIAGANFYGNCWSFKGSKHRVVETPQEALQQSLAWLGESGAFNHPSRE